MHTPLVEKKCFFHIFHTENYKKEGKTRKVRQNIAKKQFYEFAPKRWSRMFLRFNDLFTQKTHFQWLKHILDSKRCEAM